MIGRYESQYKNPKSHKGILFWLLNSILSDGFDKKKHNMQNTYDKMSIKRKMRLIIPPDKNPETGVHDTALARF